MSASALHATTRRSDAAAGRALGDMQVRPRAMSASSTVGYLDISVERDAWGKHNTHATAKPAVKAAHINPIGDGIRLPRGTG